MSYRVFVSGNLIYDPSLRDDGYVITDTKLITEVNKAGSFQFKIGPENPAYSLITQLVTSVTVYRGKKLIFYGRVLHCEKDFWLRKEVFVEGNYTFLNDSIMRPYSFKGSVSEYFAMLVNNHNSQVDESRQFLVGKCTVTDPNNTIVRENQSHAKTREEMENKLVGLLGGYIVPRYEGGSWYIDYLTGSGDTGNQIIEFGRNILDIDEYITAEDVYTVLIPVGADNGSGGRVNITSVNDGLDYVENAAGVALFGRIWEQLTWEDVTVPANLKTKAEAALEDAVTQRTTITIGAVDLSALGVDVNAIYTGWSYRVKSEPHGLDTYMPVSKSEIDIQDVAKSSYTFGTVISTMTDRQAGRVKMSAAGQDKTVQEIAEGLITTNEALENLKIAVNDIGGKYAEQHDFEEFLNGYDLKIAEFEQRISDLEGTTEGATEGTTEGETEGET